MSTFNVLCAQLTHDLFAIAKLLFKMWAVCHLKLHIWSSACQQVTNMLLCTKFHLNQMIVC